MKEVVISTSGLNCYGSRVITEGIDLTQYQKNPVLLWMHRRSYDGKSMPIGRMENLRIDGDRLIGTPVFDVNDPFAKQIADKWENDFLKMASAGIEILTTSIEPKDLLPGQTRATVMTSKLEEVSIVDIGGNDDALKLHNDGKLLTLAAGEACDVLPLIELSKTDNAEGTKPEANNNIQTVKDMKKETLMLLGLAEGASEDQVHAAVQLLKKNADQVETMQLAAVKAAVEAAIAEKRIEETKRDHFMNLGKQVGVDALKETLELLKPAVKPTDTLIPGGEQMQNQHQQFTKLSEVPADQVEKLKAENMKEYQRLYKAEYGIDL